jgi:hypothetical protein
MVLWRAGELKLGLTTLNLSPAKAFHIDTVSGKHHIGERANNDRDGL